MAEDFLLQAFNHCTGRHGGRAFGRRHELAVQVPSEARGDVKPEAEEVGPEAPCKHAVD